MNTEELLKPRYVVIADYPGSDLDVGEVLHKHCFENGNYCYTTNTEILILGKSKKPPQVELYPHLFKKLEWWEDRKPEDMPEYVKNANGKVYKVHEHFNGRNAFTPTEDGYFVPSGRYYDKYLPASQEEYEQSLVTNS